MQGLVSLTRSLVSWILGPLLANADTGTKQKKYVQCLIHCYIHPLLSTRIISWYLIAGVLWQGLVHWILHKALLSETPSWGTRTSLRAKPELFWELMQTVVLLTFTGGYFFLFIMPDLILDSALLQQHRTPAPLGVMGRSRPVLGTA